MFRVDNKEIRTNPMTSKCLLGQSYYCNNVGRNKVVNTQNCCFLNYQKCQTKLEEISCNWKKIPKLRPVTSETACYDF